MSGLILPHIFKNTEHFFWDFSSEELGMRLNNNSRGKAILARRRNKAGDHRQKKLAQALSPDAHKREREGRTLTRGKEGEGRPQRGRRGKDAHKREGGKEREASLTRLSGGQVVSLSLVPGQTEVTHALAVPILASAVVFEFTELWTNLGEQSGEVLQCPRCSNPVTDPHGICRYCRETAFQCRNCRYGFPRVTRFVKRVLPSPRQS